MPHNFGRRHALTMGISALAGVSAWSLFRPAVAQDGDAANILAQFAGASLVSDDSRVILDVPATVASGNVVELTVRVDSPMTEASYVAELLVRAHNNAGAKVAKYDFSLPHGVPQVTTRIRLAAISPVQAVTVSAVAKVIEGNVTNFLRAVRQVTVTAGACDG
ncbi:hypothetical protein LUI11_36995 [Bradyrhizobium diazoefficiens]|nr:thiosulfate oxidation carrier protein SoxY [Bradyrhizobium diazoefficiens]APO55340.1 hypothetical protein BD122_33690 [Bradyrhizobium diazoefficiens]MCD9298014.1 hypothetical protein [Bradyrhizobium diazoefficiens]MCD9815521.1 hypothetical protein [Bradyrhizobium diazoefficiens]MCD9833449.1 hypothetical protein [Bradyrhizobium diazoefficiens]MCD9852117.1 hypothetical protein [Bradyrhizobium diazoefficiens]